MFWEVSPEKPTAFSEQSLAPAVSLLRAALMLGFFSNHEDGGATSSKHRPVYSDYAGAIFQKVEPVIATTVRASDFSSK
jgi:hypothetical protein